MAAALARLLRPSAAGAALPPPPLLARRALTSTPPAAADASTASSSAAAARPKGKSAGPSPLPIMGVWNALKGLPFGSAIFALLIRYVAPYSGTLPAGQRRQCWRSR